MKIQFKLNIMLSIIICNSDCISCDINDFSQAITSKICSTPCATDEHLIEGTNSSATTASDGYFIDANDNTIKKCHSRCSTCSAAPSNGQYNCLTCALGYISIPSELGQCYTTDDLKQGYLFDESTQTYIKCPGQYNISLSGDVQCLHTCTTIAPYLQVSTGICVTQCSSDEQLTNNKCVLVRCPSGQTLVNNTCVLDSLLQPTDNDTLTITDSITDILSTLNDTITTLVDLNKTIKGDNFTTQVYHYDDIPSERDDVFSINLTQCEDILRNYYKYPSTENFIICKIDLYPENASTPQVEYQIYDSQGKPLEMKICDSITDDVSYPTVNASAIDFSLVSNLTAKGIDILNRSDPFFNDICSVNSIEGVDMTIEERRENFIKEITAKMDALIRE